MRDLELHRVVYLTLDENRQSGVTVVYEVGRDSEDAIDNVLRHLQIEPGLRLESVWAVLDSGIVTYSCKSIGNFRRGAPIPRQRDRAI